MDIVALRAATPGCKSVTHFNHASCSLPSAEVLQSISDHLQAEALNGPSEAGIAAAATVQNTRASAAELIGAGSEEIALVGSGSQGWGLAFASLPPLRAGDRVLIGQHEWGGNLGTLRIATERAGATLEVIPSRPDGCVSPESLRAMIDDRVRLVALTWLPATNGLINPAAAIGRITKSAKIPYFIDAGQALGQIPIDVKEIGCDVLKGAGRKALRGPRGTALLYVRRGFLEHLSPPYLDVLSAAWQDGGPRIREDARRFETSENPFALQIGLGVAIRATLQLGVENIRRRIVTLASRLRNELTQIPRVQIHDGGDEKSSIVAFTIDGIAATSVRDSLAQARINVAAISAAYTPIDMQQRRLDAVVRASVSYLTTDTEIEKIVSSVAALSKV